MKKIPLNISLRTKRRWNTELQKIYGDLTLTGLLHRAVDDLIESKSEDKNADQSTQNTITETN
jgi:hypothetical protein